MEAQIVEKKAVSATLKITLEAEAVDRAFESVLTQLARQMRVPGFRPGKVPRGVLERRVGSEALAEEVREALVDDAYPKAVKQLELTPVDAHFHAEAPVRGEPFEFEVHAELFPDVELGDLSDLTIETKIQEVDDETLQEAIEQLRRENAIQVPVDRPIEPTDWLMIDNITHQDENEEPEEGEATSTAFPVDLERAGDELRDQMLGHNIGDVVEAKFTDTTETDDEGNPVVRTLRLRIDDVKAKELPEPGDEFALQLGMDSWDEVLERLRASLTQQLHDEGYRAQRTELIDKLIAAADLELPPTLVNRRMRLLLEDVVEDLRNQGVTLEQYLKRLEESEKREEFEQELKGSAEKSVRRDLVLERVMELRNTELSDDELQEALKQLARQRGEDVGRMQLELGDDWLHNYRFMLTRDKAIRELHAEITGEPAPGLSEGSAEDAAVEVFDVEAEGALGEEDAAE